MAERVLSSTRDGQAEAGPRLSEAHLQFSSLHEGLRLKGQADLVLLASLGERMAQARAEGNPMGREPVHAMLHEIVALLQRQVSEPAPAVTPRVKLSLPTTAPNLTLRDGRRLGDILVQLSMLDASQVEGAMRLQRATGKRLGEALLELGLLTPGLLDSALRFQHNKRVASKAGL